MRHSPVHYHAPAGLAGVELLSCPHADVDFPAHMHDTLTVWVNDAGCEYFLFKGNTAILGQDGFGVVNPGEIHANGGLGGTGRHLKTFYVDMNACAPLLAAEGAAVADGLYVDGALHGALSVLHDTLTLSGDVLETQEAFCETFGHLFVRHGDTHFSASGREHGRFARMRDILHSAVADSVSLEELAAAAACSPQHAIRIFRDRTGISPHAYLVCLRVARVRRLLAQGRSISEAALACGFSDQSHCTRWFRRLTGTTPAAYRAAVLS